MEVICPKCKVKLKIADEKISPEGSRFKCPKCATVLLVKRPELKTKAFDKRKVMVAIANEVVAASVSEILRSDNYEVISSPDGVDAMIKAVKELPSVAILDVALPKIYGFEVCKRLKAREETKNLKVILFASVYDKNRYKRQPTSLYGAEDYLEEFDIQSSLLDKVRALFDGGQGVSNSPNPAKTEVGIANPNSSPAAPAASAPTHPQAEEDEWISKARRLARTVLADIFLYNPQKAEDALKGGQFAYVFSAEVKEGKKLYDSRIPKNIRDQKDYFTDEMNRFLEEKKRNLK